MIITKTIRILAGLLLFGGLASLLSSCDEKEQTAVVRDEKPCLSKEEQGHLMTAKMRPVSFDVNLNGKIDYNPNNVVQYVSLVGGIITNTYVSLGDKVERGQVLATVKSTELNSMQADLVQLQSRLKVANRELKSTQSFYESGISSEKDLISSESEVSQIESQIANLRSNLELFSAKPEEGVFEIKAPGAGYLVSNQMASGLQINAGDEPLFTLSNLDEVWVNANVYAKDIVFVEEGMSVRVTANSFGDKEFEGKIDNLSQIFDPGDNVVKARVVLENQGQQLKPGLNVRVTAQRNISEEAIWLPKDAVIFDNDQYYVMIAKSSENCTLDRRLISISYQNKDGYFVDEGLTEGEEVLEENALLWFNAYASI